RRQGHRGPRASRRRDGRGDARSREGLGVLPDGRDAGRAARARAALRVVVRPGARHRVGVRRGDALPAAMSRHDGRAVTRLPWPALAGMMMAAALAPLGSTMIAVALPSIGDAFHTKADLTPWLVASYLIASIALQSPGGRMGDLVGHGRALAI